MIGFRLVRVRTLVRRGFDARTEGLRLARNPARNSWNSVPKCVKSGRMSKLKCRSFPDATRNPVCTYGLRVFSTTSVAFKPPEPKVRGSSPLGDTFHCAPPSLALRRRKSFVAHDLSPYPVDVSPVAATLEPDARHLGRRWPPMQSVTDCGKSARIV
jgi:hypothetical protein